jgi:hypothetical protein
MTDQQHQYEVTITAEDAKGNRGIRHIEYRTRLTSADDVPHEIATELGKSLGKDCVTEIETDR